MSAARVRPIAHRTRTRGSAIAPVHSLRPAVAQPIDSYRRQAGFNGLASATARYRIFSTSAGEPLRQPHIGASGARRDGCAPLTHAAIKGPPERRDCSRRSLHRLHQVSLATRRMHTQRNALRGVHSLCADVDRSAVNRPFEAPVATRDEAAFHATGSATRPSAASDANLSKDSAAGATTFRITGQPMYAVICMISSASSSRVHAASIHCRI